MTFGGHLNQPPENPGIGPRPKWSSRRIQCTRSPPLRREMFAERAVLGANGS